jgi:hypothetical protein
MADTSHAWRLAHDAGNNYTIYEPGNLEICIQRFHPENVFWENEFAALEPGDTAKQWWYYLEEEMQLSLLSLYRPRETNYHLLSLGMLPSISWWGIPDAFAEQLHQFMAGDITGV